LLIFLKITTSVMKLMFHISYLHFFLTGFEPDALNIVKKINK